MTRHSDKKIAALDVILANWDGQFYEIAKERGFRFELSEDGDFSPPFRRFSIRCESPPSHQAVSIIFERDQAGNVGDQLEVSSFYTIFLEGHWITKRSKIWRFNYAIEPRPKLIAKVHAAFSELEKMISAE